MANLRNTSKLSTKLTLEARNNEGIPWSSLEAAVELLLAAVTGGLPPWDNRSFTYYGATNNANVVTYKMGATSVATVTYTYVAAGAADNDRVLTETIAIL